MPTTPGRPSTTAILAEVEAELRAWAEAHPEATLYEMEVATERQLARVRAALLGEVVARAAVDTAPARPTCPTCGVAMQQTGTQERTVTLPHDAALTVTGPRYRCPACGTGGFPPR